MVNYGQPQGGIPDRGYILFITAIVMVSVAGLFVVVRLACRIVRASTVGKDDAMIIIGLFCSILLTTTIDLAVVNGYGRHMQDLSKKEKNAAFRWFFISQVFYKLTLGFTKASIVLLYLRIFITNTFQRLGKVFLFLIAIWAVGTILATIFQCVPVRASWDKTVHAKCINKDAFWYSFAVTNTVTDFLILLLPLRPIFSLHLPTMREKLWLLVIFSVGIFVCVTSIIRTVAVTETTTRKMDRSWEFIPRGTWTLIEANTGIICACLPMLRQPLSALFPRLFRISTSGRSDRSGGSGSQSRISLGPIRGKLSRARRTHNNKPAFSSSQSQEQIISHDKLHFDGQKVPPTAGMASV